MNSLVNKKIKPGRGGYSPAEKERERMKKELYNINAGCDDERDDPFYDYIAIETEVAK